MGNKIIIEQEKIGKGSVNVTAVLGTVLSADSQMVANVHSNRDARGLNVSTSYRNMSGMWLQMDDGREMELPPMQNGITAREGQKVAVIGIQNDDGVGLQDWYRVNLSTGATSFRQVNLYGIMKKLTGAKLSWFAPIIPAALLGVVVAAMNPNSPAAFFGGLIPGYLAFWFLMSGNAMGHQTKILDLVKKASQKVADAGPSATSDQLAKLNV